MSLGQPRSVAGTFYCYPYPKLRCRQCTDDAARVHPWRTVNPFEKPVEKAGAQRDLPAYRCCTVEEMFQMYLSFATDATASHVTTVNKPISVGAPFPRMFDPRMGRNGDVLPDDSKRNDIDAVQKISTVSGLHNCPEVGNMLESLHTETRRIRISRLHQFTNEGGGIEKDDFEECLDNLFTLRENYENNYVI
nr:unnamed protein product [Callosobruchus chinensis]